MRIYLVDTLIEGLGKSDIAINRYCISNLKMNYCLACKRCYINGDCVQNDDVRKVVEDIVSSDYVVIAAPSYWADVPAQLKTFFDRNTPYGDTNPNRNLKAEKRIKGIAIAVRSGVRQQENELILNSLQHYFGHLGIETIKRISICQTENLRDLLDKHQKEIEEVYELGKQIAKENNL